MSGSIMAAAAALRGALAGFDAGVFSGADCARIVEEMAVTEKACAAVRALAGVRAAECKAHLKQGFNDPSQWMASKAGISAGEAKRTMKTAERLADHADTREAMLAGALSVDQANEIVETAEQVAGSEGGLIELARSGDLNRVKERARDIRTGAVRPEDLHERQVRARTFRAWRDQLGMIAFAGALPPEVGVPFLNRLERQADRLRNAAKQAGGETEPWNAYAADAFAQMISGTGNDPKWRTELTIVCDLRAWRRGHAHEGEPCHILDGGSIPVDLAKRLSEDAFLNAVIHDGIEIATFARLGRHIPAAVRAALDLGEPPDFTGRRCVDCGRRDGLELDHDDPVANGGPTSYNNLKHRCYLDHQAKTEKDRQAGLLGPRAPNPRSRTGHSGDCRNADPGPAP